MTLRCVSVMPGDLSTGVVCPQELSFLTPLWPCWEDLWGFWPAKVLLTSIPGCPLSRAWVGLNNVWGPGRTQECMKTSLFYYSDNIRWVCVDAVSSLWGEKEKQWQQWRMEEKESRIIPFAFFFLLFFAIGLLVHQSIQHVFIEYMLRIRCCDRQ